MSFCEHCTGQRFDRAQVLRALRITRKALRDRGCGSRVDKAIATAIEAVRALEIPHLEYEDEGIEGQTVH